jgi:hypothetical protein
MLRGFRSFFNTAVIMGVAASKEGKGKIFGGIGPEIMGTEAIMSKKGTVLFL